MEDEPFSSTQQGKNVKKKERAINRRFANPVVGPYFPNVYSRTKEKKNLI
jgi:hypothetical protein